MTGRIFFEVTHLITHLAKHRSLTGIQRTVVSIVGESLRVEKPENIFLAFWDPYSRAYRALSLKNITPEQIFDPESLMAVLGMRSPAINVFPPLRGYVGNPLKLRFHSARFALFGFLGNERIFRRFNSTVADWRAYKSRPKSKSGQRAIKFFGFAGPEDRLFILDSAWKSSNLPACFQKAFDDGVSVYTMVHDLIPLVRPDLCPDRSGLILNDWLLSTLQFTTRYLANSTATQLDMESFIKGNGSSHPVTVVRLAQSLVLTPTTDAPAGPLTQRLLEKQYPTVKALDGVGDDVRRLAGMRYVLCVGSMEIRKNNWRLLHAWDLLRRTLTVDEVPRLVFAGERRWMNADFFKFLEASGHLDGLVSIVDGPTDRELDLLYRNCLFTAMPSLYEGWGLPVGESLSYGKTSVISDITSLPEVGGDMVLYCDPYSVNSIMECCRELLMVPGLREELEARIASQRLRSWRDVVHDLLVGTQTGPEQANSYMCGETL